MKTLTLSSHLSRTVTALALLITALFFLASCQKDESLITSANSSAGNNEKIKLQVQHLLQQEFAIIKIEHVALKSALPDYVITIFANGTLTYEGRKNVTVLGKITKLIPEETLSYIKSITRDIIFSLLLVLNLPCST